MANGDLAARTQEAVAVARQAVAWPAMAVFVAAVMVLRLRPYGQTVAETLATKRKVARKRWPTDGRVARIAPGWAAALAVAGAAVVGRRKTVPALSGV